MTWNVNAQARINTDFIGQGLHKAIFAINPDVVILTEYLTTGDKHIKFAGYLRDSGGYLDSRVSTKDTEHSRFKPKRPATKSKRLPRPGEQNRVAIFSKFPLKSGCKPPNDHILSARSNYLHVRLNEFDIDLVGLRVPFYNTSTFEKEDRSLYVPWLKDALSPLARRRTVVIGDLNFDPVTSRTKTRGHTWMRQKFATTIRASLDWSDEDTEWKYVTPSGPEPSFFISGTCIDHAMISRSMDPTRALPYINEISDINWYLRNVPKLAKVPDHAMFCIEIDLA